MTENMIHIQLKNVSYEFYLCKLCTMPLHIALNTCPRLRLPGSISDMLAFCSGACLSPSNVGITDSVDSALADAPSSSKRDHTVPAQK